MTHKCLSLFSTTPDTRPDRKRRIMRVMHRTRSTHTVEWPQSIASQHARSNHARSDHARSRFARFGRPVAPRTRGCTHAGLYTGEGARRGTMTLAQPLLPPSPAVPSSASLAIAAATAGSKRLTPLRCCCAPSAAAAAAHQPCSACVSTVASPNADRLHQSEPSRTSRSSSRARELRCQLKSRLARAACARATCWSRDRAPCCRCATCHRSDASVKTLVG